MNQHDLGRLRAYMDGELLPAELGQVTSHLEDCAQCRKTLVQLRGQAQAVNTCIENLDFQGRMPEPQQALARLRAASGFASAAADRRPRRWESVVRSLDMKLRNVFSPRWRPVTVAVTAVLLVTVLFSIAPVREVAADFLGLFRVRKFAVIPLDPGQMDRLASLAQEAEAAFDEPQTVREEGPEQVVADAAQATVLAGYGVRTPGRLPEGAALEKFVVQAGPAMHFEFSRDAIVTVLQAAGASTDGLPQTEKIAFDVDVANMVIQNYHALGAGPAFTRLEFIQAPSPQVNLPEGIDPIALAKSGFLLLGMPAEDAERMANSIDWTSTLVIPLPTNAAKAREVSVDGVTGLLLEGVDQPGSPEASGRQSNALLWERDGILYFLTGNNLDERTLLDAADSLQ